MKYSRYAIVLVLFCVLSISLAQEPCSPSSLPLQLGQLQVNHSIDSCQCVGAPKGEPGSQLRLANNFQNTLKNNFTRSTDNPGVISISDMIRLQDIVDNFSQAQLPRGDRFTLPSQSQRDLLKNLTLPNNKIFSEGDVVTLAGFVLGARHSNLEGGESVNCERSGCGNNDVHIEVSAHPRDLTMSIADQMNEEGVVAEIVHAIGPLRGTDLIHLTTETSSRIIL